jgi:hypothetical protein
MNVSGDSFDRLRAAGESLLIALLGIWTLASAAYASGWRWRALRRWNAQFRFLASWRVFGAKGTPGLGRLELDQRVCSAGGETGPWTTVRDTCWAWHAFLCFPQRRVAHRLFHLIREMAEELERRPGENHPEPTAVQRVAWYLGRVAPLRPDQVRELRLIVRHLPGPTSTQVLQTFRVGPDGNVHG